MKVLFVWTGVTSYMADCWRELAAQTGVELKVVVESVASGRDFDAAKVLDGLDHAVVAEGEVVAARAFIGEWRPDVIFAVGWHSQVVRSVVKDSRWRKVSKVCCFDLPWDGSLRRILARWVLWPFLRHYAAAYVPGEACERYAKWLGFKRIVKGLFAIDTQKFAAVDGSRQGFLYLGRFSEEKRLDVLVNAYHRYRELGGKWTLDLYGRGDVADSALSGLNGVAVHEFVQPEGVPALYAAHGALVLTSDFDPWPLVALQACANGMPVIASDSCMNRPELFRDNAVICPAGDIESFAAAMLKVERGEIDGESGRQLAVPYDCRVWARRTIDIISIKNEI